MDVNKKYLRLIQSRHLKTKQMLGKLFRSTIAGAAFHRKLSSTSATLSWLRVPPKIYFKAGCLEVAMAEFSRKKRVFIVTDNPLFDLGISNKVTSLLDSMQVQHMTFYHVEPEPDLKTVLEGGFLRT